MVDRHVTTVGATGKGTLVQRIRLWSGLVLFFYVTVHFLNHSLGHISISAMEKMLAVQEFVTNSIPGMALLYGALITHSLLGLWKLAMVRSWKLPVWEWTQILLGLAIPWMLISHITFTRASELLLGVGIDYTHELAMLWPGAALQQSILLVVVWLHGCAGIHFWLRIRSWYRAWVPAFTGIAVTLPVLALTGWISAARRLIDLRQEQDEAARTALDTILGDSGFIIENMRPIEIAGQWLVLAILAAVILFMIGRWVAQLFRTRIRVTYGDGSVVTSSPGLTLLDISRQGGIPHMSVCGGRARCSTCRTLIVSGDEFLSERSHAEALLLDKLHAGPEIRLACQARVNGDIEVRPLIQSSASVISPRNADPLGWGVERELTVFFLDIRGFSQISENNLPYDVVFILNSFFAQVGAAVEHSNGYIDKFMGDGMMVLFGLGTDPQQAGRDAIVAALKAQEASEVANGLLEHHLRDPLRIGIGVHTGQVVVGRIGKTSDQTAPSRLTAIGETVNIAARLEAATKELSASLVISAHTFEIAGIAINENLGIRSKIQVRNITEPVDVVAIRQCQELETILGIPSAAEKIDVSKKPAVKASRHSALRNPQADSDGLQDAKKKQSV